MAIINWHHLDQENQNTNTPGWDWIMLYHILVISINFRLYFKHLNPREKRTDLIWMKQKLHVVSTVCKHQHLLQSGHQEVTMISLSVISTDIYLYCRSIHWNKTTTKSAFAYKHHTTPTRIVATASRPISSKV